MRDWILTLQQKGWGRYMYMSRIVLLVWAVWSFLPIFSWSVFGRGDAGSRVRNFSILRCAGMIMDRMSCLSHGRV